MTVYPAGHPVLHSSEWTVCREFLYRDSPRSAPAGQRGVRAAGDGARERRSGGGRRARGGGGRPLRSPPPALPAAGPGGPRSRAAVTRAQRPRESPRPAPGRSRAARPSRQRRRVPSAASEQRQPRGTFRARDPRRPEPSGEHRSVPETFRPAGLARLAPPPTPRAPGAGSPPRRTRGPAPRALGLERPGTGFKVAGRAARTPAAPRPERIGRAPRAPGADMDLLRDENLRLNEVFRWYPMENSTKYSSVQRAAFGGHGGDPLEDTAAGQSTLSPLLAEYEKHMEELSGQLKLSQRQMGEMKLQLENVIKENERLHCELKDAVEKQLEALPFDTEIESDMCADGETVRNLQEQLQLSQQEKAQAVELWQAASQQLERLQKLYQEHVTEAHIHVAESQKQKDQLTSFQHLTRHLHVAHENVEMTNQHFLKAITEQNVELEQLRKQLRQAKLDLRVAAAKVEELTRLTGELQGQMQRKEEVVASAQGREEASDRRAQQLQTSIKQLESRLCVATQEASQLRTEKARLEKQTKELQAKCTELENEKYEAVVRARNSLQLLEDANLLKSQALFEEKQKEEDIENMRKSVSRLLQDAALRTRKEVTNTRKQYVVQISRLTEELSALQLECAEKQSQIERIVREKKAVEEELDKVHREGRGGEGEHRTLEEAQRRCLAAERARDELQLGLRTAESRLRQRELRSSEELSRCQEMIQKLQDALEAERESCGSVSEQRLKLQQENEQLQRETEELRKVALEAQKKAKLKISTMEHEFSIKERGFEVQLREMEDSSRNSTVELRHLLATQQKTASRWREEARKVAESAEVRISSLKSELSRQKLRTQELLSQLEMASEKAAESEKLILEHQEKASRLQRRLSQAEQRAASAVQQLSAAAVQRRRAASRVDLEGT
ncbi:sodium channel and clathrin linker 1 [Talpa occidentalis]|uniref:sodium channel and clathrin linker 1 n=1 Tax=Talpa occidentalis TaxID=50954 RepID=UPI00188E1225|nr:sodium channel and clathrin linker 1 [Talpa occidentalis]